MEKYILIRRIGCGSYGVAYLGREKSSGDLYVLKEIDARRLAESEVKKIALEIKVLSSMNHEFIVKYHDYCTKNGSIFIVMKYCSGGDMHDRIKKQGRTPFSIDLVFKWFLQTALVLHYLHEKKVIHRDVKPQNLFLDEKGDIKVGDFGISRVLQFTQDMAQTAVGTPLYVAPEVVKGMSYDAKADVWSLGCSFYEILTLVPPFTALSLSDLMGKVKRGQFIKLESSFDTDLRLLIHSMLEVDPMKRPTIDEILRKPCCLTRLHALYPHYIPTLFPYTTPITSIPQIPGSTSSATGSTSTQSTSKPQIYRVSSKGSHGHQPTVLTPSQYSSSSNHDSNQKRIVRSGPAIVIQRLRDDSKNDDGISDESSVISNPRRVSLPSNLVVEVKPIIRRLTIAEPTTVQTHFSPPRPTIDIMNGNSFLSSSVEETKEEEKKQINLPHHPSFHTVESTPVISMLRQPTSPPKVIESVCSNASTHSVYSHRGNIKPVRQHSIKQAGNPTKYIRPVSIGSPETRSVADSVQHGKVVQQDETPTDIKAIPMQKKGRDGSRWRVPSAEEEKKHKEGLQELRQMYHAMRKKDY